MVEIKLIRFFSGKATMGVISCPLLPCKLFTLELPDKGNIQMISRIPAGKYNFVPHGWNNEPVKFSRVWRLLDVPNRSNVLIHWGNYLRNTDGCILVGRGATIDANLDCAVTTSVPAIDLMRNKIGERSGTIEIIDVPQ
jgi:hypothetical protein